MEVNTSTSPIMRCYCGGHHTTEPHEEFVFETLCCELLKLADHKEKRACLLRLRDVLLGRGVRQVGEGRVGRSP